MLNRLVLWGERRALLVLALCLSLVAAISIWLWFPNSHSIFIRADSNPPLNIRANFLQMLKIWLPINLGIDNSRIYPTLVPYSVFWYLLRGIFNDSIVERLWWIFLETIAIFSATWLCAEATPEREFRVTAVFLAVSTFAFSGYGAISFATGHGALFLAMALAPAMLAATLRYFRTMDVRWAFCAALLPSFGAGAFANPPMIAAAMVIPEVCLLAAIGIMRRRPPRFIFRFIGTSLIVFIFLNSWWLFPFLNLTIFGGGSQILIPPSQRLNWPNFTNKIGSRFGIMGIGYWGLFRGVNGHPYFPSAAILWNPLVCIATAFILCCISASLFRRAKSVALFPLVGVFLYILGIWGAKANNEPAAALAQALFKNVPGLWIFRSAYEKFESTALVGALLSLPQGYQLLIRFLRLKFHLRSLAVVLMTSVCAAALSFPFLSGTLVKTNNPALGYRAFVDVPPEYEALSQKVAELRGGRILVVPGVEYALYKWGAASGDILRHYLPHPYISVLPHYTGASGSEQLLQQLAAGLPNFEQLASEAGVRYILVRSDVDEGDFGYQLTPASLSFMLKRSREIFHDRFFKLYKLAIAIPPILGVERDPRVFPIKFIRTWYGYSATLPANNKPSYLVLRNNFNSGWRLAGIPGAGAHSIAGDFANRWRIPMHPAAPIQIYFTGAVLAAVGAIITVVSLLCLLILASRDLVWRYRHRAQ